ncbi:Uracil-DNA glycosylase [Dyadobacter sp. CECT 9623]|jgi:uracil-DNA glycosylase|uniref:Uracil-DNA glycosylase n=1 Tax=Dyadobacter linearis TaxID=2823330 RepID=A0ABM8UMI5_9BACT|nr:MULTISPECIES: uracil-DNA glycosylase [unclassified Dyadobacter]MCE7059907.1 uracil-DNA glycosylase [Dyadobacter sp. CY343]CAG5068667.1 Uracil-DNA glycosylase [Dyadobacter sp. CECT 9623]
MDVKIEQSWKEKLAPEFEKPYFEALTTFVKEEYKTKQIYPPAKQIFNAFNYCTFDDCRVVILGQDPYHGPGQANGLSFSVNDGVRMPPSLNNIFKEIQQDLGKPFPQSGNLERWAKQGVLLLNATLTVQGGLAGSHQNKGWERFTDAVIKCVSDHKEDVVYMLWGRYAQEKGVIINANKNLILKAKHPSPMSANNGGWFGTGHFSKANEFLTSKGLEPINW